MDKYKYVSFGDDVPREIEKVYNRMLRHERYLIEQDIKHGTGNLPHDPLLENLADRSLTPEYQAEQAAEELHRERMRLLPVALKWLKTNYPDDYKLIKAYYYTNEPNTLDILSKRYGITKQALSKRLAAVRGRLRKFITAHETNC